MSTPMESTSGRFKPQTQTPVTAQARKKRKAKPKPRLLFIDTNIFLDFYRARNDAGISLFSKIDALHDQTITTCQVAMEFKKNRQKVIAESVSLLKPPEFNLSTPAFLSDAATVKVIKDRIQDVKRRVEKMKSRIPPGNRKLGKFSGAQNLNRSFGGEIAKKQRIERNRILGRETMAEETEQGALRGRRIRAKYKGKFVRARLRPNQRVRMKRKLYGSPSAAARAIPGRPTNGF